MPDSDGPAPLTDRLVIGVAATCLLAVFLTGNGTGDSSRDPGNRGRAKAHPVDVSPSASALPDWEGTRLRGLRVGESFHQFDHRTTTVMRFRDPYTSNDKSRSTSGARWVGLEIRTCAGADMAAANAFSVGAANWSLLDAQGDLVSRPMRTGADLSRRQLFPVAGEAVNPGECVQGWVLWRLAKHSSATAALFSATPTWFDPQGDRTIAWVLR